MTRELIWWYGLALMITASLVEVFGDGSGELCALIAIAAALLARGIR